MRYVVTGAAGFIGSHLCQALLAAGHAVVAVDCFTDYYDVAIKYERIGRLRDHPCFTLVRADLAVDHLDAAVAGSDAVFHLAGQPGVRQSWDRFDLYVDRNVLASQRLLEAARRTGGPRLVVASSSSVYGDAAQQPTPEHAPTRPFSPYGVTKLAMEQLCWAYAENWGLNMVVLRYFTVYGPGQRPDMAIHRFIRAALDGEPVRVHGDGNQVRDFTHVADAVAATVAAAGADLPSGTVLNVAGGAWASVNRLLELVAEHTGRCLQVLHGPAQAGDVRCTGGSIDRAQRVLGWAPAVSLSDGVRDQVAAMAAEGAAHGRSAGGLLAGDRGSGIGLP